MTGACSARPMKLERWEKGACLISIVESTKRTCDLRLKGAEFSRCNSCAKKMWLANRGSKMREVIILRTLKLGFLPFKHLQWLNLSGHWSGKKEEQQT